MSRSKTRFSVSALVLVLALTFAGCGEDETDKAKVRVIHLSSNAGMVDIWIDGTFQAVDGLGFLEGTQYLSVSAGTHDFSITPDDSTMSVLDINGITLAAGKRYTIYAYGSAKTIRANIIEDNDATLEAGTFRVRAIHAAEPVGTVDISEFTLGIPLYENVPFMGVGEYLTLDRASYNLGFDVNGDMIDDLVFRVPELPARDSVNLFAVNDGPDVFLVAQFSDSSVAIIDPAALLRAFHLSPDAGRVDIWANGAIRAVDSLGFLESTEYLVLDAGTYDFSITPDNDTTSVLDIDDVMLEGGMRYTVYAYDEVAFLDANLILDDVSALAPGTFRVRAIHTAREVGEVDIWVPDLRLLLYENFGFGGVGSYISLGAGDYILGFDVNNDQGADLTFSLPSLPAGRIVNVFAVNNGPDVFMAIQFLDSSVTTIDPDPR